MGSRAGRQVAKDTATLRARAGHLTTRSANLFILLHAFEQLSARVSAEDIDVATARWGGFKGRTDRALRRRLPGRLETEIVCHLVVVSETYYGW